MPQVKRKTVTQGTDAGTTVSTGAVATEDEITRENPSVCPICNANFTEDNDLQIHLQNHSKREIIEEIMACNSLYTSSAATPVKASASSSTGMFQTANMSKRARKLTGAKPYRLHICSICSLLCSDAPSLAAHHVEKHKEIFDTSNGNTDIQSQTDSQSPSTRAEMYQAENNMDDAGEDHFKGNAENTRQNVVIKTEIPDPYFDGINSESQETEQFSQNVSSNASLVIKTEVPEFSAEIGQMDSPLKLLENVKFLNNGAVDSDQNHAGNMSGEEESVKCEICDMEFMDSADLEIHNTACHIDPFKRKNNATTKTIAEKGTGDIGYSQGIGNGEPGAINESGYGFIVKNERVDDDDEGLEQKVNGEPGNYGMSWKEMDAAYYMDPPAKKKRGRPKSTIARPKSTIPRPKSTIPKKASTPPGWNRGPRSSTILLPPGVKPEIYVVQKNKETPITVGNVGNTGNMSTERHESKVNIYTPKEGHLYTCHVCKKTFASVCDLRLHMYGHPGENLFKCEQCGESFNRYGHYNDHKRSKHSESQSVTCQICKSRFRHITHLRLHMYLHTGSKPYICCDCGEGFTFKCRLNQHIKEMHETEGTDPLKCRQCQKKCKTKKDLALHMIDHSGGRKHQCTICDKAFLHASSLNIHTRKHSGERPFKCEHCSKTYRSKYQLRHHMAEHTGVYAKMCQVCNRGFTRNEALNNHIRICHGSDVVGKTSATHMKGLDGKAAGSQAQAEDTSDEEEEEPSDSSDSDANANEMGDYLDKMETVTVKIENDMDYSETVTVKIEKDSGDYM